MNSDNKRDVYIPEGGWVNLFTGEKFKGKQWLNDFKCPMEEMPVWVRKGATIAVYPHHVSNIDEMDLAKSVKLQFDTTYNGLGKSLLKDIWGEEYIDANLKTVEKYRYGKSLDCTYESTPKSNKYFKSLFNPPTPYSPLRSATAEQGRGSVYIMSNLQKSPLEPVPIYQRFFLGNGLAVKSVGIARASGIIGLINLTYNLFSYEQVVRLNIIQLNI